MDESIDKIDRVCRELERTNNMWVQIYTNLEAAAKKLYEAAKQFDAIKNYFLDIGAKEDWTSMVSITKVDE